MLLERALEAVEVEEVVGEVARTEVSSIVADSREARPGSLFCCVRGTTHDGHEFAGDAVSRGASALLVERLVSAAAPQARVSPGGVRHAMAAAAAELHGRPSCQLMVVGVTGTNGKTTVTHLLRSVLESHGWPTALIGTIGGSRTTPEAPVLQEILAKHRDAGGVAAVMEVSSHALVQCRVDAIRFRVAAFTNLSPEHLDYHTTMESYFESKARLFSPGRSAAAVVNADDPWGKRLAGRLGPSTTTYSLSDAGGLRVGLVGSNFTWKGHDVTLRMGGEFNVQNALAAATVAGRMGVPSATVAAGLSGASPVPGRMEPVSVGQPFSVLVDYAHTPDGLRQVLAAARASSGAAGRVLVVFGCGGERDKAKRPVMGEVAASTADVSVVTSDNPRGEDPISIISEVVSGASGGGKVVVEPDRGRAIRLAVESAHRGDVVVIAGKGHERVQQIGGRKVDFDDRSVAISALQRLQGGGR